ncbi:hypothetical protein BDN72DRAFT_848583 [Pluteus cervinus]|uniref:Uncharacterized protein n=1 Tax=Pluteus cervinus TaxID=181527 RepID=A0ACD3AA83_9AGAR|nr:hypothetical protein BDN72DRAFT_848583 [Pluteus cervinus]
MALHESGISPNSVLHNVRQDELQHQHDDFSSKAAELKVQLAALTAEYAKLEKAASFYQAALAPWKQLPNEVLQRIFCWTKSTEPPTCVPFSRTVAPMQLTQVCSRWRAVAFATPTIWQDLKCTVYLPPDKYERYETIAFLQSWVSRAAYLPLSIVAIPPDLGPNATPTPPLPPIPQHHHPIMQNLLQNLGARSYLSPQGRGFQPWLLMGDKFNFIKDIITPNTSRIRDLHITFPMYYRHTLAFLQQSLKFPALENITLDFTTSAQFPPPNYSLLKDTPSLRRAKFGIFNMTSHTQLQMNWSRITHFEAGLIPSNIFLRIFGEMKSLQSCKATLQWIGTQMQHLPNMAGPLPVHMNPLGGPTPPIDLPFLHTLELSSTFNQPVFNSDNTNLPNLKVLSLAAESFSSLATSLLKSTISLSELRIKVHSQPMGGAIRNMLHLPALSQLTHFTFELALSNTIQETIDQHILRDISLGQLIPHLHTFHFSGKIFPRLLGTLLATKGFVSVDDGSTIFPEIGKPRRKVVTRSHLAASFVAPFQLVKITGCRPDILTDADLEKIQDQVGEECFVMEAPEMDQWVMMHQIGWDIDE